MEALPERSAAGDELHRARTIDLDAHAVGGTQAALLDEHRKAGADRFAGGAAARKLGLALVPLERDQELVEQPDVIARIVLDLLAQGLERPGIWHFTDPTRVAPPHLFGIDGDSGRNSVDP